MIKTIYFKENPLILLLAGNVGPDLGPQLVGDALPTELLPQFKLSFLWIVDQFGLNISTDLW